MNKCAVLVTPGAAAARIEQKMANQNLGYCSADAVLLPRGCAAALFVAGE